MGEVISGVSPEDWTILLDRLEFGTADEFWCSKRDLVHLFKEHIGQELKPRDIVAEFRSRGFPDVKFKQADRIDHRSVHASGRNQVCRSVKFVGLRLQ